MVDDRREVEVKEIEVLLRLVEELIDYKFQQHECNSLETESNLIDVRKRIIEYLTSH